MRNWLVLVGGLAAFVSVAETDIWAPIVDENRPQGLFIYDVGDYVQDGLVAHFDGIRNVGADQSHDSEATTWKNLIAGEPDAVFHKAAGDTGAWTANGYAFAGKSYAQMSSACVALGMSPTFQLATDVDYAVQPAGPALYPNLFAAPNDVCIFFNNNNENAKRSTALTWKTEPYAMTNYSGRCELSWTDGRYLTAMLDAERQYLFSGTDRMGGKVKPRTKFQEVAALDWTWGGSANGPSSRYLIGTVHSVRLYNRMLTDDELVRNRRIDDIRFHGTGGNVDVRTSLPGAEGDQASGSYGVNGTHAFTAPASVSVGEATYAPAGYQLEVWNTLSNVWEFAAVSDDTTFTYTNCVARARVRLTWLWKMTGGQVRLDADAYAPLGLVGNWDGIRNAGLGAAHDDAATTWKNCVADGVDAEQHPLGKDGAWEPLGYRFAGGSAWKTKSAIDLGENFTLQFPTDVYTGEQNTNNFNGAGGTFPSLWGTTDDVGNIYTGERGNTLNYRCDGFMGGDSTTGTRATMTWDGRYATAFVAFDRSGFSAGPTLPTWKQAYQYKNPIGSRTFYFGGVPRGSTAAEKALRCLVGTMFAVRAYTRVLTPVEMAWNRLVDDARFRGIHTVAATGLVAVAGTAATGYGADDGVYLMRDGSRTFMAPASVERDGVRSVCAGYLLETFDSELRVVTNTVTQTDTTTCTLTADTTVNRRITWLWRTESRLRTAADYDVGDYVQAGLVAHYDGIRNISVNLPHDPHAVSWRDLSGQRNRLAFYGADVSQGGWTNGAAYSFNQSSYGSMVDTLALGKTLTVELALDIDLDAQTCDYPNYFGMVDDFGVFTKVGEKRYVQWKNNNVCGGDRPQFRNWQGKYLTAMVTETDTYLFEGTTREHAAARTVFKAFGNTNHWTIAAAPWNGGRYSKGFYYAARFYNRPLTEAELAYNRKVDEIRFRGVVVTNVVVASQLAEAQGVETNGVYEVEGSWTFTALPTVLESGKTVRPTGYSIETLENGVWSAPVAYTGTNYTYTAGTDVAPVRLTWRYHQGTLILFR